MTNFQMYLEEAQKAVEKKYQVKITLFLGEYTPDIDNFLFHYYFLGGEILYKVTVNSWAEGQHRLLIRKYPLPEKSGVVSIDEPINLSLSEAFEIAVQEGYQPNLYMAAVFLENSKELDSGPGYWFMNERNDREWIFVSLNEKKVKLTKLKPYSL